jgi:23S rRNA-/tRNA-specific pseudouridylate synthase
VDKPQGTAVYEGQGDDHSSLFSQLLHRLSPTSANLPLLRPQPVHRLDRDTGGLLLVAKTRPALQSLSELFSSRQIIKEYTALCANVFEETTGSITFALSGQTAHTNYEVTDTHVRGGAAVEYSPDGLDGLSVLRVSLLTGRTHQIRRHLDMIGHPIIGDKDYFFSEGHRLSASRRDQSPDPRRRSASTATHHYLWSTRLCFAHPVNADQVVDVALPEPPGLRAAIDSWMK